MCISEQNVTDSGYSNTWHVPFLFDDEGSIGENPTIRQLWPIWKPLCPPNHGETVTGRPLLNLSFAVNYAISGLNVWSYHVANLSIHILAALLLFGILRWTFLLRSGVDIPVCTIDRDLRGKQECLPRRHEDFWLAFVIALLWVVHPLQTESVTYIVQRAESLVGLFYLLTLYCFIRGATSGRGRLWYAAAVLTCVLGMASKEVMVSAPLIVLLYDRTFLAGSFREAWRRRRGVYLALAATWLLLGWLMIAAGGRGGSVGFGTGVSSWAYLRTQFGAIVHYLKLCVWPHPLLLDYGRDTVPMTLEILFDAILVALLGLAMLVALCRWPKIGFLGACFFAILAPTSSIVPVAMQVVAEHRMYLPLVAVLAAVTIGGYAVWRALVRRGLLSQRMAGIFGACAVTAGVFSLGDLTYHRNVDYHSELSIWQDAVDKASRNVRAYNNLGIVLEERGRIDEAIAVYRKALKIDSDDAEVHANFGLALAGQGRIDEAIAQYRKALKLKSISAEAHNNYGLALEKGGQIDEAIAQYRKALKLKPDFAEAHNNYGLALEKGGQIDEAIAQYRKALKLKPDLAVAHNSLGMSLASRGQIDEATAYFRKALELNPKLVEARNNLGMALMTGGHITEAAAEFLKALEIKTDFAEAHNNLGIALARCGRIDEAIVHFRKAVEIKPEYAAAKNNLDIVLGLKKAGSTPPLPNGGN